MAQAAAQRIGYANSGPVEAPADDDTVYPTTAPKWDMLSPEAAMMGASVGYANGGPVIGQYADPNALRVENLTLNVRSPRRQSAASAPKGPQYVGYTQEDIDEDQAVERERQNLAQGGPVQPADDINKRASLLAGLRKRYDAMIAMAQGAHAHGDLKAAAHLASKAHDMVPDGKNQTHNVTPDGHILSVVHGRGGVESTHPMTSQQFHHYLVGPATSFDHVIDNGVGHNLHIASGRQQPRMPEHPADPIHRVRQVLQHTRKMFGLHRIGQASPRVGYAAGGPVRGYADGGGEVDPSWDYGAYYAGDNAPPPVVENAPPPDQPPDQDVNLHQRPVPPPGFGELLARAGSKYLSDAGSKYLSAIERSWPPEPPVPDAKNFTNLWEPTKQALADYVNGTNAAPPAAVDAALAKTAAANPGAGTADVVQKTIAGTADPLSPGYMDRAGQDALGGLGRSATAGQAPAQQWPSSRSLGGEQQPAQTGYDQTTQPTTSEGRAQALGAGAPAVPRELTRQDLINEGMSPGDAARVLEDNGAMVAAIGPKVSRFLPPGFLDDPYNRATLAQFTTQRGEPSMSGSGEGGRVLGRDDYLMPGGNDGIYESLATKLINRADNRAAVAKAQARQAPRINPYYNPQVGYDSQNPPSREGTVIPQYDIPSGGGTAATGGGSSSNNKNTNSRSRGGARGRRSDAGDGTGVLGPYAMADTGTMSDASNDVRSNAGQVAQTGAAVPQTTGYANQPPSAGGFSGSVGNNVTDIRTRQGDFTPAGAAPATPTPAGPAPTPTYPNGMKLVPTSGGQYDRALVGSDGVALRYIPKGAPAPSSDDAADAYTSRNLSELQDRLKRGDPTALAQQYDVSKPLPPAQAATPQSTAAAQAELATRAAGGRSAPGGQQSNDPVQDLLRRAAQTSDVNAQRMFTNEAYKIQEQRRINQQKSADAALSTFNKGQQELIKSIFTKSNSQGEDALTPDEKALKNEYVVRMRQHSRDQQGGDGAAAGGQQPVRVNTIADAARLPPGTQFIDPNGNLRTR